MSCYHIRHTNTCLCVCMCSVACGMGGILQMCKRVSVCTSIIILWASWLIIAFYPSPKVSKMFEWLCKEWSRGRVNPPYLSLHTFLFLPRLFVAYKLVRIKSGETDGEWDGETTDTIFLHACIKPNRQKRGRERPKKKTEKVS